MIDLELDCKRISTEPRNYDKMNVFLEDCDESDFDKEHVAKCISLDTFIKAHGIQDVLDFITDEYNGELMEHINNLS